MAYIQPNLRTEKALKEAVASGIQVTVFSPGPFGCAQNGIETVEGPHGIHRWYAQVQVENGLVTKVIS